MRAILGILVATVLGTAAWADDNDDAPSIYDIANDVFEAGATVDLDRPGKQDVFALGETITATADIGGTAHLFGRKVTVNGAVGGDIYSMGQYVTVASPVAGNVTAFGMNVDVKDDVAGNIRASGSKIVLDGNVGGYALIFAEDLQVNGVISGDLVFAGRSMDFGPNAKVEGTVRLHEPEKGQLKIPERIAALHNIERQELDTDDMPDPTEVLPSKSTMIWSFLGGVLSIAIVAALIAALMPEAMAKMRRSILAAPGRSLARGFVTESTIIGGGVLLVMTLIGILLLPAVVVLAFLAAFLGQVVGAYALGVKLLEIVGRGEPTTTGQRAISAGVGALVAGLICLIPFFGWIFYMLLFLVGIGGIIAWLFPNMVRSDYY
ncbi:bactofilin family protein [Chachezhania sediminis]|uniref:hypothetical protein n=1 Tax=Chachezhania sediminis TaxID=2599291 RepID=UPI00131DF3E8|nr:hypothetical protein [Chachezhania sediminis]